MSKLPKTRNEILDDYRHRIQEFELKIKQLKKQRRNLATGRFIIFILGLLICWIVWPNFTQSIISLILFSVLFIYLVFRDSDKAGDMNHTKRLVRIIRQEMDTMTLNLQAYEDGFSFMDPSHAYVSDMDLFGPFSIFQWINRCRADLSKKKLADLLKNPLAPSAIKPKQEAAAELSKDLDFRLEFQSLAMDSPLSLKTEKRLNEWMEKENPVFEKPYWKLIRWAYPLLSLTVVFLFLFDQISYSVFLYFLLAFIVFSFFVSGRIQKTYELLTLIEPEMESLFRQMQLVEKQNFKSQHLLNLQGSLRGDGYNSAAAVLRDFHNILKRFDMRLNLLVFFFLNFLFLWDLRQQLDLNAWKNKNRKHLPLWFDVLAETEVLISIASLVHNEPEWIFPELDDRYFHLEMQAGGHPLIPADLRVNNDFQMEGTGKIAIITGSNMAGKSTFLRTLGTNIILAQMGAPVCAGKMRLSGVQLVSSMRIADNLAENTSTFYAELKKLEFIIDAVNKKEKVFILLDEVLRGTNSDDRHKGSQALIRQLLREQAVAVIATHDTALAHTESQTSSRVSNYHFEGSIREESLYFDYKIKNGICESLNATTLMKKIGIQIED